MTPYRPQLDRSRYSTLYKTKRLGGEGYENNTQGKHRKRELEASIKTLIEKELGDLSFRLDHI